MENEHRWTTETIEPEISEGQLYSSGCHLGVLPEGPPRVSGPEAVMCLSSLLFPYVRVCFWIKCLFYSDLVSLQMPCLECGRGRIWISLGPGCLDPELPCAGCMSVVVWIRRTFNFFTFRWRNTMTKATQKQAFKFVCLQFQRPS